MDAATRKSYNVAQLVYLLHALSILSGVLTSAIVLFSFITGIPSLIAVVINYLKRDDARGTWVDSHFGWQIRTFWYALAWTIVAAILFVTFIGIPLAWLIFAFLTLWVIYRVVRGWLRLRAEQPM
ncbi:MAG: hypothetical protein AAGA68_24245 [Pseudomonadota bacterium]